MIITPKKIHQWIIKALEEPLFCAEMHRVEMSLPERMETLLLVEGGKGKRVPGQKDSCKRSDGREWLVPGIDGD